jgi:hypothetical protein
LFTPIARGTAPLVVTVLAAVFAHEVPDGWAAAGIAVSCAGLTGVALWGLRGRRPNWAAIGAALATGLTIAAYTVVDGLGVRASGSSLGYTAWLMAVEGVAVPAYALYRWRGQLLGVLRPFAGVDYIGGRWATLGAALSVAAYGFVLWVQELVAPPRAVESAVQVADLRHQFRDRPLNDYAGSDLVDWQRVHWRCRNPQLAKPCGELLGRGHVHDAAETDPGVRSRAHRAVLAGGVDGRGLPLLGRQVCGRPAGQLELRVPGVVSGGHLVVTLSEHRAVRAYQH